MSRSWIGSAGLISLLFAGTVCAAPAKVPVHTLAQTPAGLMAAVDRTDAREAAANPAYAIDAHGCARLSSGHGASLETCFTRQGPRFSAGRHHLALRLSAWGRAGHLHPVHLSRGAPRANRIAYQGPGLQEWWRVLPMRYEQGFTLNRAPVGKGWVVLEMKASEAPTIDHGTLAWGKLRYGKLKVIDAAGRALPSRLTAHDRTIALSFDATQARFPVTVDPTVWTHEKLTASDGAAGDEFGYSVALSADGTTALVGATSHFVGSSQQGQAYIYHYNQGGSWSQVAELRASDGDPGDLFGTSVALSADGTTALVGAPNHNMNGSNGYLPEQGLAYLYVKPASGWPAAATETAKLTASDAATGDQFGTSVALSADGATALVGAPDKSITVGATTNDSQGAVYLYTYAATNISTTNTSGWIQSAELTASDGAAGNFFGTSVALSADGATALVGAPDHMVGGNSAQGAAYLYTEPASGGWATTSTQTAELTSSDGVTHDYFGSSVALSANGSNALVGAYDAPYDSTNGNAGPGAAYCYGKPAAGWSGTPTNPAHEDAKLTASNGMTDDAFGWSVALSADGATALVGSPVHMVGSNLGQGAAYLYTTPTLGWSGTVTQTVELVSGDGAAGDRFGYSMALSADGATALVGELSPSTDSAAYLLTDPNLSTVLSVPPFEYVSSAYQVDYTVINNGTTDSDDVKVSLPVPSGASYDGTLNNGVVCSYDSTSRIVTCDLGTVAGSGGMNTAVLELTAAAAGAGTDIIQHASVYGSPTLQQLAATFVLLVPTVSDSGLTYNSNGSDTETLTLTGTGPLTVTAHSNNPNVLPDANITGASACTGAGTCALTLTPVAGQSGSATVTVQVADNYGQTASGAFKVDWGVGAIGPWMLLLLGGLGFAHRRSHRDRTAIRP